MVTPPLVRCATCTFISVASSSTSWLWMFSEPDASPLVSLARLMSAFIWLIWRNRSLMRFTFEEIRASTVSPSSLIWALMRPVSVRKSSTFEIP